MIIESGRVVTLALTITDLEGKRLQRFTAEAPTAYLHGHDDLVAALEAELTGQAVGHHFDFEADDAYGPASAREPSPVPRRELPRDWRIQPGLGFYVRNNDGELVRLYVHEVRGSRVYVSDAHPWAGRRVRFQGEVLAIRNATQHEREHGHAHGVGSQHDH